MDLMAVFAHRNCVIWPVVLACEKGNWAVKSKLTVSKLTVRLLLESLVD